MLNLNEAVKNLMEMFKNQKFPEKVAFTIIQRRNADSATKPSDRWSIGNLLIMAFIGKTEDARTYKQWKAVKRYVKRGSKAFNIFAPVTHKVKKADTDNSEDEYILVGFRALPVFRYEDTDGEPLQQYDYTPPELPPFFDVAEKLGLTVKWQPFDNQAYGWFSPNSNSITLSSQDAFIYFHELAHAVNATFEDLNKNRNKAEIVADLTAAVLCELQGISGYQRQTYYYIQQYCQDKSDNGVIKAILSVLNDVEKIVTIIIDTATKPCAENAVQG